MIARPRVDLISKKIIGKKKVQFPLLCPLLPATYQTYLKGHSAIGPLDPSHLVLHLSSHLSCALPDSHGRCQLWLVAFPYLCKPYRKGPSYLLPLCPVLLSAVD